MAVKLSGLWRQGLLGLILLTLAWPALADLRIGFVNPARVTAEAPQADAARALLEDEFSGRDQELAQLQQEVSELEQQLTRETAAMSETELRRTERELASRQREIRRSQEEFREDFNMRRNEELSRLQRHILETIHEVARDNDFDLVLSEGVVFASDKVDITDKVIERLEEQHRAAQ
ncbi:periplasmic chaperone for outer membrane proteins Skp [Alkalispirillum mobile]|uniref:Periplasmic chaperone for outer membrane proteins Skp n=1 Tax=Alkalispirillum mobile TaxID=85925 RepID=A0A498C6M6_9GAMM|nr:OmpH family outer membrane protein [Alkalispirillum mobile]RLK50717.1 periplasmic chaperone for outer membrane proteins Skp [Alkalispirillum mobile]